MTVPAFTLVSFADLCCAAVDRIFNLKFIKVL